MQLLAHYFHFIGEFHLFSPQRLKEPRWRESAWRGAIPFGDRESGATGLACDGAAGYPEKRRLIVVESGLACGFPRLRLYAGDANGGAGFVAGDAKLASGGADASLGPMASPVCTSTFIWRNLRRLNVFRQPDPFGDLIGTLADR
jgi:hypothetical protein